MKKVIKTIKEIDAYKVEQTFNTCESSDNHSIGSVVGGLFTLTLITLLTVNFVANLHRMNLGKDDVQTHKFRPNYLLDGENIINITDSTFLPSLELYSNIKDDTRINAIIRKDGTGIVMEELLTYIEPVIMIVNETEGNPNQQFIYPMKVCTPSDFEKKGLNLTTEFSSSVSNRLCPDIKKDDPHYIVKNLYSDKKERVYMSINILKCNNNTKFNCKDDKTMQEVFQKIYIN
jgi:hypothetical protein